MLARFGAFLVTVPVSAKRPGFTHLTVRAVDSFEAPVFEEDLRALPLHAGEILDLMKEHLHADVSYQVSCHWDLSVFDAAAGSPQSGPQALEIFCHGEEYDGGLWRESGHMEVCFGFEHLFTGHAGMLGVERRAGALPQGSEEARFFEAMAWPENLEKYQQMTRENIRKLLDWVERIEQAVPAQRVRLWSEGEENLEARLEDILAKRG